MKFLDPMWDNEDIIPINLIYDDGNSDGDLPRYNDADDTLAVVFKDLTSGKLHVAKIVNPKVDIYIVKPQYRTQHFTDYVDRRKCDVVRVRWKTRFKELSEKLRIPLKDVRYQNWIVGTDVDIVTMYMYYFLLEYQTEKIPKLNIGMLDIENDIRGMKGKPIPGEMPINLVTYITKTEKLCYVFILRDSENPLVEKLEQSLDSFTKDLHTSFDDEFGEFEYQFKFYDEEIVLIAELFAVIRYHENDYLGGWNMPYDCENLIRRPAVLGYDPVSIICDPAFPIQKITFRKDNNPIAAKRKHIMNLGMKTVWSDMLVNYSGTHRGKSKPPSLKLNAIAESELGDKKVDFAEFGDFVTILLRNFELFTKYNIKDVLLLSGIDDKCHDFDDINLTCTEDGVLPSEAFVTTTQLTNSIRLFYKKKYNFELCNNRNKLFDSKDKNKKYALMSMDEDEYEMYTSLNEITEGDGFSDAQEDEESSKKKKNEKQYTGAFVSNANRMQPTTFRINGRLSKFVHEFVIDFDIKSEYPTAIILSNLSNDTFVGKVILENERGFKMPMFYYKLVDDEPAGYKHKPSAMMMEYYSEKQYTFLGSIYLNLPSIDDLLNIIEENPNTFLK